MKSPFPSAIAATVAAATVLCSCTGAELPDAGELVAKTARNLERPDSLNDVRDIVSRAGDSGLTAAMARGASQSTLPVKAQVLALVLKPGDVADTLIHNPSRGLAEQLRQAYLRTGDTEGLEKFASAVEQRFDGLTVEAKAQFVTAIGTPAECAENIEASDRQLVEAIRAVYAAHPELLEQFNTTLSNNPSFTHQ